ESAIDPEQLQSYLDFILDPQCQLFQWLLKFASSPHPPSSSSTSSFHLNSHITDAHELYIQALPDFKGVSIDGYTDLIELRARELYDEFAALVSQVPQIKARLAEEDITIPSDLQEQGHLHDVL